MGIFTWTDARKVPKRNKWGDFADRDVIRYGGYAKVVCPDNTEIVENHYNGYGMFGGKDIYELVTDWNKKDIAGIIQRKIAQNDSFYRHLNKEMPGMLDMFTAGKSAEEITEAVKKLVDAGKAGSYLVRDWKRNIGIMIACNEEDNNSLKYPIKITTAQEVFRYDELVPSISTQ